MVVPFVLPDTRTQIPPSLSLGKEEGTPRRPPLNLSLPSCSRYPQLEMNSPDERIWRTVIVSVGAAGISREGTGRWHKLNATVFKVSLLSTTVGYLSMLDDDEGTFQINWLE